MGGRLIAIYASRVIAERRAKLFHPLPSLRFNLRVIILGIIKIFSYSTLLPISRSLIIIAISWSFTTIRGVKLLYQQYRPSRAILVVHDLNLLYAAPKDALTFTT